MILTLIKLIKTPKTIKTLSMLNVKKVSNKIEDEKNDSIALQEFIGGN